MAVDVIKIPKDFARTYALIRDGQAESIEKLNEYKGFEHQKAAVLAEIAYFNGDLNKALDFVIQICQFWGEWYYSNIRTEHISAMAFAATVLEREYEIINLIAEQSAMVISDMGVPGHIKNAYKKSYEIQIEFIKTGIRSKDEIYKNTETPLPIDELIAEVKKENKKLDIESNNGQLALFKKCRYKGNPDDTLTITMTHKCLSCFRY